MKTNSLLIVGCGDIGTRVGRRLQQSGWSVTGVRRDCSRLPAEFEGVAADYSLPGSLDFIVDLAPDYVLATCSPSERSVAGYERGFSAGMQNLLKGLGEHRSKTVLWASSTRVYAENEGAWVDEKSRLATDDPRASAMIEAEQALLHGPHRGTVIRFAGIYGAAGGRLLRRIQRGELSPEQPLHYSNRIHRDDCAGFLCHLIARIEDGTEVAEVYNAVDDLPAPRCEVERWLAAQMEVPVPPLPLADTEARASISVNKRCSNRLLRESGYALAYPDYRSGYGQVLAS